MAEANLSLKSKSELLTQRMIEEATQRPAGSRLPTVSELMDQYQVSRTTVDRALRYLKENHYVEATVGRGIFTLGPKRDPQEKLERVDYIVFGNDNIMGGQRFQAELMERIGRRLGQDAIWLRTTILPVTSTGEQVAATIDQLKPQAAILVNLRSEEVGRSLQRQRIPTIYLFPTTVNQLPNAISIDNRTIARHWCDHLTSLGHRQIAILNPAEEQCYFRDFWQRQRFFYEEMGRHALPVHPALVANGGHLPEDAERAVELLLSRATAFTAIICGDSAASGVYNGLLAAGLTPGRDISVMGVDDESWAAHLRPPLTTVRVPKDRIAQTAIQKLGELVRGEISSFEEILIPTDLVVRQSTTPISTRRRA